ncbi:MAG: phosphoserine phosphatase RsbU/P [Pseudomonadota bacterium]|nr:phosphoserine phosphatase RsbU/P [Pseudomonadota bacterium]
MAALTPDQRPAPTPVQVRLGLASRLSLALTGAAALVFATAFYYNYQESRRHLLASVNETIAGLSGAIISDLGAILKDSSDVADHLAKGIESGMDEAGLRKEAETAVLDCSYCNGATLIFDAGGDAGSPVERRILRCQYHRSTLSWQVVCDSTVAPTDVDAMTAPETADWRTTPTILPGRDSPVAIYTRPVHRMENGVLVRIGAVSTELPLHYLQTAVASLRIFQKGYVFILSSTGQYLAHPDAESVLSESLIDQAHQYPELINMSQRMLRGETGFVALRGLSSPEPVRLYFMPLSGTHWSVGIVFADEELFAEFKNRTREVLCIGGVGLLLLALLTALIIRRFTRPLLVLTEKSVAIAHGDLDIAIPTWSAQDEVGILTRSFADMRQALRQQLDILANTRAAQAQMENELKIARTIQVSFLPRDPARLAAQGGLDVATWFQPAREVGGDLFHCFWLADGRLFLSIGDVAGKGVPAALMMGVTVTLIKGLAAAIADPDVLLERVNRELCAINEEMLFVTFFAAMLNPQTGELRFSNAGHNPPLIRRRNGSAEFMVIPPGLPLGIDPDGRYTSAGAQLDPGDILLLYTDGVTEAMNSANACFEPHRLLAVSRTSARMNPRQWVDDVVAAVAIYVGTAEPSDDLTLLAVARPSSMIEPTVE